ncbi:MAG: hypothetical protein ACK5L6_03810 [Anaerorhabdus sp.]|uniref:hypothetical protein n=1 Tax=Anaerorhabdus sp. TaxID=1872524 RepID=UPI003A8B0529
MDSKKTILDIDEGSILEVLNIETLKILENISNPATDSSKSRELTIKFIFKSNDTRDLIDTSVTVKSKLVPLLSIKTTLMNSLITDDDTGEVVRVLKEYSDVPEGQMTIDGNEVIKETIAIKVDK